MLAFRWDCLEQFSSKHFCGVIESGRSELWRGVTFSKTWKGLDIDPGKAVPDSMSWDREICTACWTNHCGTRWKTAWELLMWPRAWPFPGGAGLRRARDRQGQKGPPQACLPLLPNCPIPGRPAGLCKQHATFWCTECGVWIGKGHWLQGQMDLGLKPASATYQWCGMKSVPSLLWLTLHHWTI